MTPEQQIAEENRLLRSELGTSPLYEWKHASTLFFRVQKIIPSDGTAAGFDPQYEYKANPKTGLVELAPIYVDMPMLPMQMKSWVLARYCAADQEQAFKQRFGVRVEYPANGIWQPISQSAVRPGIIPSRKDTWKMIYAVR